MQAEYIYLDLKDILCNVKMCLFILYVDVYISEREINTCVKECIYLRIYVCITLYASTNNHLEEVSIFSVILGLCEVKITDTCG